MKIKSITQDKGGIHITAEADGSIWEHTFYLYGGRAPGSVEKDWGVREALKELSAKIAQKALDDYLQEQQQKRIAQSFRDKLLARENEIISAWAGKANDGH